MKIGVISNLFPPEVCGGYEIGCGQVVEGLRAKGMDARVLTSKSCSQDGRDYVWNTLSCSMGVGFSKMGRFEKLRYLIHHERENLRVFKNFLAEARPDVLYFWNLSQTSRSLITLARQSGIPYGVFVFDHGLADVSTDPWLSQFQKVPGNWARRVQRVLMALAAILIRRPADSRLEFDFLHYPTRYLRDLLANAGVRSKKWTFIPWGVDTEVFRPAEAMPEGKLLYVGQVSHHKGVHLAIEAVGMLKAKHPELSCHLTITGRCANSSYEAELRELVARYDLKENVSFTGFVAREDLPELYRRHAILLFASVWDEPMGISILEAMASGLVVISSGTGGSGELFEDGISGRLFEPSNISDLPAKIEEFLANPRHAQTTGLRARELAYSKYQFFETIERIIKNIQSNTRE